MKVIEAFLSRRGLQIVRPVDLEARRQGQDWPPVAHTMIGSERLNNLRFCVEDTLQNGIPGDFIEAGVWRGGATILMRAILKAYGVKDRKVWVADSFAGLPPPDQKVYPLDFDSDLHMYEELAVSLEEVQSNFGRYGLLDNQVCFLKGWFKDTLPNAAIDKLAVIRLDGDMYESISDSLNNLYHKLSLGGYLIVDDYLSIRACREAVLDFRRTNGITDDIVEVDWCGVYWQKRGS